MTTETVLVLGALMLVVVRLIPLDIKLHRLVLANKRLEDKLQELAAENRSLREGRPRVSPGRAVPEEKAMAALPESKTEAVRVGINHQTPVAVPAIKMEAQLLEKDDG